MEGDGGRWRAKLYKLLPDGGWDAQGVGLVQLVEEVRACFQDWSGFWPDCMLLMREFGGCCKLNAHIGHLVILDL